MIGKLYEMRFFDNDENLIETKYRDFYDEKDAWDYIKKYIMEEKGMDECYVVGRLYLDGKELHGVFNFDDYLNEIEMFDQL